MFVTQSIMKTPLFALICGLALAGGGLTRAMAYGPNDATVRTTVMFFEPEKFTDVANRAFGDSDQERNETLSDLRTHFIKQANRLLAPGQQLKITFTDIDLAGEFEPWRGGALADVRIVKDIYPPTMKLAFQLKDADGNVLKQGDRTLRDMGFMMTLSIDRNDPLRFEKELFDNWVRDEFRGLKNK